MAVLRGTLISLSRILTAALRMTVWNTRSFPLSWFFLFAFITFTPRFTSSVCQCVSFTNFHSVCTILTTLGVWSCFAVFTFPGAHLEVVGIIVVFLVCITVTKRVVRGSLGQRCTNPGRQYFLPWRLVFVGPLCVWNLCLVILLGLRTSRWLLDFWEIYAQGFARSRKFQDTPTTLGRWGSHFPPTMVYAFPARWQ
jgi:hypothetical protein